MPENWDCADLQPVVDFLKAEIAAGKYKPTNGLPLSTGTMKAGSLAKVHSTK